MESRNHRLEKIVDQRFDLVVIGAGVHGAFAARSAAEAGMNVLLLEAQDYASGSSSRSSKMLHGGLRYLEQIEFRLVFEALRERAVMRTIAPHLTKAHPFIYPIIDGKTRPRYQVRTGLFLYDFLASFPISGVPSEVRREFLKHSEISALDEKSKALQAYGLEASALMQYYDGYVDDARVVIAAVRDAAELGATVLNYAPVHKLSRVKSQANSFGEMSAEFLIEFSSKVPELRDAQVRARAVINAAGPWINDALLETSRRTPVRLSQGSHLVFSREWKLPAMILPTPTRGRYYFIWPYHSADRPCTLVGTTETELSGPTATPTLRESERVELLGYLQSDLPRAGLNEENLIGSFSGIRVLPGSSQAHTSELSRATKILKDRGLFSIVGGKFTTGRLEAERAVKQVIRYVQRLPDIEEDSPAGEPLLFSALSNPGDSTTSPTTQDPSSKDTSEGYTAFRALPGGEFGKKGVEEAQALLAHRLVEELSTTQSFALKYSQLAVNRFGSEAATLSLTPPELHPGLSVEQDYPVLPGEIRLTILREDPITVEDVFKRRLGMVALPKPREAVVLFTVSELSRHTGRTEAELHSEYRAALEL